MNNEEETKTIANKKITMIANYPDHTEKVSRAELELGSPSATSSAINITAPSSKKRSPISQSCPDDFTLDVFSWHKKEVGSFSPTRSRTSIYNPDAPKYPLMFRAETTEAKDELKQLKKFGND